MAVPTTLLANSSHISTTDVIPSSVEEGTRGIVSDDILKIFTFINFSLICGVLVICGSIANIINIIVFFRIGFKETINISLLAIAISDFLCCFSMIFYVLCFNPSSRTGTILCIPEKIWDLPGRAHILFARITSCLTAFITLERCLCVAAPLKVKEIITPKRVAVFIVGVNIFLPATVSPRFFHPDKEVLEFDPEKNKSISVPRYSTDLATIQSITFSIHNIFIPTAAFLAVVISTICLVMTLKRKRAWRKTATQSSSSSSSLSARDAKVSKMVVRIAVLFIVCYIPALFSYIGKIFEPEYGLRLKYHNLFVVIFSFHFVMECINSSLNIFIYYSTSSIYKAVSLKMFCRSL